MLLAVLALLAAAPAPVVSEGDHVLRSFKFASGESLPELRIHYRTLGKSDGRNAVLILHGTGGSGAQFLTDAFAGVLFGTGQLLDAGKYFIVLPDGIGHGKSSKPSDGLHAKFPHYTYDDMVEAQYRLLREKLGVDRLRRVATRPTSSTPRCCRSGSIRPTRTTCSTRSTPHGNTTRRPSSNRSRRRSWR